ncbi:hypothetical protein [Corynebacterium lubricantis]|uniref:hypothetical protein n=1 Tax=Corynebacterium lubricantis TaxID=541095 RepID=UPI000370B51A|nr:hypothetical protein [Corynebacterium lubricantis]
MKKFWGVFLALLLAMSGAPVANAIQLDAEDVNERTALALVHSDGTIDASENAEDPRPALSLSKLYLGYWVIYNGSKKHKSQVEEMLRLSHDGMATEMDRAYPEAIDEIASDFELESTYRNGYWGKTRTSAVDVTKFISAISYDPRAKPVFEAMSEAANYAHDGFSQDYGTSQLPGVEGTKFGWSNDHETTATVSFGEDWAAASMTFGDTKTNTKDTLKGFTPALEISSDDLELTAQGWALAPADVESVDQLFPQSTVTYDNGPLSHGWLRSVGASEKIVMIAELSDP